MDPSDNGGLNPPGWPSTAPRLRAQAGKIIQTRPVGRTRSRNEQETYRVEVQTTKRRTHTTPWSDLFTDDVDPVAYGTKLFKRVLQALVDQNMQTGLIALAQYDWLLPGPDCTPDMTSIYDRLYREAPTVTNTQLKRIMKLERSTLTSPAGVPGSHYFYVRTLELHREQLRDLVDYMRESDEGFEEVDSWRAMLQLHESHVEVFTLRYWGTVKGPQRPIDRHLQDVFQTKKFTILGELYRALEALFPEILHSTERGGHYSSFLPSSEDRDRFAAIKTDVWRKFKTGCSFASEELSDELSLHFDKVQEYARNYPQETGTGTHDFTDSLKGVYEEQARPLQYHGRTLTVCLGKDITYTDYLAEKSFWDGGSRAAVLTKDILHRIVNTEATSHGRDVHAINLRVNGSPWTFVDLWQWLWHRNSEQALFFLRQYLTIVRSLIVVSLSRPVNAITRANFVHQQGVPMHSFTPLVGEATIQYYFDPTGDGSDKEDCAFINIGHIHPGFDKYRNQPVVLRRLLEVTWQKTFIVQDIAMHVLDKHAERSDMADLTQLSICCEVLKELKSTETGSPYQEFFLGFDEARRNCISFLTDAKTRSSTEDVRPLLNRYGREKLAALGQAEGEQMSPERRQYLEGVWALNKPDLHIVIPHDDDNKERWIGSFMTLQPGQYLFLTVLSSMGADESDSYTLQLLSSFRPDGEHGTAWFKDAIKRDKAVLRAGLWIQKEADAQKDDVRKKRLEVHFPQSYQTAHALQNSPIGVVSSSGLIQVRWRRDDGVLRSVRFSVTMAVATSPMDTRVVHFTPAGIDILDAHGNAFRRTVSGIKVEATIPRGRFRNEPDQKELWKAVLTAHGIPIPDDGDGGAHVREWGPKGVPAYGVKDTKKDPQHNRPVPKPEDANFIIYEFLNEYFPNGGEFQTISREHISHAPDHVSELIRWIKRPEYNGHPYREFWLLKVDTDRPILGFVYINIPVYRACTRAVVMVTSETSVYDSSSKNKGKPRQLYNTILSIQPPDTAVDDPFDVANGQSKFTEAEVRKYRAEQHAREMGLPAPQPKTRAKRKGNPQPTEPPGGEPSTKKAKTNVADEEGDDENEEDLEDLKDITPVSEGPKAKPHGKITRR